MDAAVGLVQAYLRVNGFFTVTEYPIVALGGGGGRSLTDIDVLAVRFPNAKCWVPEVDGNGRALPPDPALNLSDEHLEMIIGEVKEGKARLNESAYSLPVIEAVIRRFGCCHDPAAVARAVFEGRKARTHASGGMACRMRMVVFGGAAEEEHGRYEVISIKHVMKFLNNYIAQYRDVFLHAQIKDDALDLMALLVKVGLKL